MTTPKQLRHINILIEELEALRAETPKPKFNMKIWCALRRMATRILFQKALKEAIANPCGTSGCLCGKAGLIPRIRRMGFKWVAYGKLGRLGRFQYKNFTKEKAIDAFFGEEVRKDVFYNTWRIRTLLQGIKALKKFSKRVEQRT